MTRKRTFDERIRTYQFADFILAFSKEEWEDICKFADQGCIGAREESIFNSTCSENYQDCPAYRSKKPITQQVKSLADIIYILESKK